MKKHLLILSALLFLLEGSCQKKDIKMFSENALSQKLTATDHAELSFGQIIQNAAGKVTLIEVWASWCGDCVKAMPWVKTLKQSYPDVQFVYVSMDKSFEKWQAGIEKHQLQGTHYWAPDGMQGAWGKTIQLDWIPRYILLDKNGAILKYYATEKDTQELEALIKQAKP
jgi:thiol-disulfide isomerase/thioredoxin